MTNQDEDSKRKERGLILLMVGVAAIILGSLCLYAAQAGVISLFYLFWFVFPIGLGLFGSGLVLAVWEKKRVNQ